MSRTPGRHAARRGAVGSLWFLLFFMPVFFVGMALSEGSARMISGHAETVGAATAAANAGVLQFEPGTARLREGRATYSSRDTSPGCYDRPRAFFRLGADPAGSDHAACEAARMLQTRWEERTMASIGNFTSSVVATESEVEVTIRWRGLFYGRWLPFGSAPDLRPALSTTVTAQVCVPGVPGPTGGFCQRPPAGGSPTGR